MGIEDVVQGVQVKVSTDGVDNAASDVGRLDKAISDLGKTAETVSGSGSGRGGAGIGGLTKAFSDLSATGAQAFASIARSASSGDITGLATLIGGRVGGAFAEAGKALTEFIDTQDAAILKNAAMAKELGTTPGVVQGLKEGFEGAGVSAGGFERLVNRMSRQVTNDYADMTRNIRTDNDTQESATLRLQAAQEKLQISLGVPKEVFEAQDKLREQKLAHIAVDQAQEGVRQQALKSIPHVTELLNESARSGKQNADLTEVTTKTLRESIEHMAQTGTGPASPIDVLKKEFELIHDGAIGADKAVELLKEQMGSMRAAGLGGMDAQHLADYAKAHGGEGITAAQAGQGEIAKLGLTQTAADTQRATETITAWSKFTGLFSAMMQKIGASFSGEGSALDQSLKGGEKAIGFFTRLARALDASGRAPGVDDAKTSPVERFLAAFNAPPNAKPETPEAKGTPVGGGVRREQIGGGPGVIYHLPDSAAERPESAAAPSAPQYQRPDVSYDPNDPRFQHMSVTDDLNAPWRNLRSPGTGAAPPPVSNAVPNESGSTPWRSPLLPELGPSILAAGSSLVSAITSVASAIKGIVTSPSAPAAAPGSPAALSQSAAGGVWRGGAIHVPGFAGGGRVSTNAPFIPSFADGGMVAGFAEGGSPSLPGELDSEKYLWAQIKNAPGALAEYIRNEGPAEVIKHYAEKGIKIGATGLLAAAGATPQGRAIEIAAGVATNILSPVEVARAGNDAGAAQTEAQGRAAGARNLRDMYEANYALKHQDEEMWGGGIPGFAMGSIKGPGTGTSDSILARVSNGEFVMRDAAVRTYGEGFMHAINNMQIPPPKYAVGGMVPSSSLPHFAADGGMEKPGSILNLHVGGEVFSGLRAPAAVADQLRKFAVSQQTTQTGKKPSWAS